MPSIAHKAAIRLYGNVPSKATRSRLVRNAEAQENCKTLIDLSLKARMALNTLAFCHRNIPCASGRALSTLLSRQDAAIYTIQQLGHNISSLLLSYAPDLPLPFDGEKVRCAANSLRNIPLAPHRRGWVDPSPVHVAPSCGRTLGPYLIGIASGLTPGNPQVIVIPHPDCTLSRLGAGREWHPHVDEQNILCAGTAAGDIKLLLREGRLGSAIAVTRHCLEHGQCDGRPISDPRLYVPTNTTPSPCTICGKLKRGSSCVGCKRFFCVGEHGLHYLTCITCPSAICRSCRPLLTRCPYHNIRKEKPNDSGAHSAPPSATQTPPPH